MVPSALLVRKADRGRHRAAKPWSPGVDPAPGWGTRATTGTIDGAGKAGTDGPSGCGLAESMAGSSSIVMISAPRTSPDTTAPAPVRPIRRPSIDRPSIDRPSIDEPLPQRGPSPSGAAPFNGAIATRPGSVTVTTVPSSATAIPSGMVGRSAVWGMSRKAASRSAGIGGYPADRTTVRA